MKINENALKFIFSEELYRTPASSHSNDIESSISFVGKNKKNILIVVPDNEAAQVIKKNNILFLEKILNSIGLTTDDIVIVNNQSKEKWTTYVRDFSPNKVIFFGIKPFELGITELEINSYELKQYQGQTLFYADKLEVIKEDINKKKALWINLKKLFT